MITRKCPSFAAFGPHKNEVSKRNFKSKFNSLQSSILHAKFCNLLPQVCFGERLCCVSLKIQSFILNLNNFLLSKIPGQNRKPPKDCV